jgi:hypothetical protein
MHQPNESMGLQEPQISQHILIYCAEAVKSHGTYLSIAYYSLHVFVAHLYITSAEWLCYFVRGVTRP